MHKPPGSCPQAHPLNNSVITEVGRYNSPSNPNCLLSSLGLPWTLCVKEAPSPPPTLTSSVLLFCPSTDFCVTTMIKLTGWFAYTWVKFQECSLASPSFYMLCDLLLQFKNISKCSFQRLILIVTVSLAIGSFSRGCSLTWNSGFLPDLNFSCSLDPSFY